MSTIRALKGAFTSQLSLWARPSPHIAFRPHISSHQPLSGGRPYSDDKTREWSSLQDFFNDQIRKPSSQGKGDRSKQTKEDTDFDDGEDGFSRILSPKQEKPKKPWLKKREESIARRDSSDKADARRSRKTARNINRLEQEISRRHAAGRPDITSAIDPERSEITPRTAKEAIARLQEMKEKDREFQPKESRAIRALKRDVRREAKEARIFMASQTAEKAWEHEFEQIEKEKKPWNVKERKAKERLEKLKRTSRAQPKNAEWEGEAAPVKTRHVSNNKKISQSLASVSEPVAEEVSFTPQQESPVSRNARAVINEGQADVSEHVFQALGKLGKTSSAQPRNTTKLPQEDPAQAQQNAVQTPEKPQENDSPEETAENPEEWEDELDDDAEWAGKKKPSKQERRRMKLLLRFKEGLQRKMGVPVGDTNPHPEIDAKCEAWLYSRIEAEEDRERRKKARKKSGKQQMFQRKLARKARNNANPPGFE